MRTADPSEKRLRYLTQSFSSLMELSYVESTENEDISPEVATTIKAASADFYDYLLDNHDLECEVCRAMQWALNFAEHDFQMAFKYLEIPRPQGNAGEIKIFLNQLWDYSFLPYRYRSVIDNNRRIEFLDQWIAIFTAGSVEILDGLSDAMIIPNPLENVSLSELSRHLNQRSNQAPQISAAEKLLPDLGSELGSTDWANKEYFKSGLIHRSMRWMLNQPEEVFKTVIARLINNERYRLDVSISYQELQKYWLDTFEEFRGRF